MKFIKILKQRVGGRGEKIEQCMGWRWPKYIIHIYGNGKMKHFCIIDKYK
jgi:hypothetical protein